METLSSFISKNTAHLLATTGHRFSRYQDNQICIISRVIPRLVEGTSYYRVYYYKEGLSDNELWCDHNSPNGRRYIMIEKRSKIPRQWKRRS